jgi:hypothetical protein
MMVSFTEVQSKVYSGYGHAARFLGGQATQYRPYDPMNPVGGAGVLALINAAFDTDPAFSLRRPAKPGEAIFYLLGDAADLLVGDYLQAVDGMFFVASLENVKPPMVIRTNATLSLVRPQTGTSAGANAPGGDSVATETTLLSGWPAAVLSAGHGQRSDVDLPGDTRMDGWEILLPPTLAVEILSDDILVDENSLRHVVIAAEASPTGWRIQAVQEST